jgi:HPt (histidine-containing phosphotransfer) domain-containing protein
MDDKLSKPVRLGELKEVLEMATKTGSPDRSSPKSGSHLPVCDEDLLNELSAMDDSEEFLAEIIRLFIGQAEQLASRLPQLADDPEVLASEAHRLKGAAASVGAVLAAHVCDIVENAARLSEPIVDQKAVAELKESLTVSADDYRKRLKRALKAV